MNYRILSLAVVLLLASCASVPTVSPRAQQVGRLLAFPGKDLVERDVTEETQKRHGPLIRGAWAFSGRDQVSFARLIAVVGDARSLLTDELRSKIIAQREKAGAQAGVQRIAIGNEAEGFVYSATGPGGSEHIVVLAFAGEQADVQVKLTIPGDPPLAGSVPAGAYRDFILSDERAIGEKLAQVAREILRLAKPPAGRK